MITMQKVATVNVKVYPELVADVIEWKCPECEQSQKEYTYHSDTRVKFQCERCGKTFTRIP